MNSKVIFSVFPHVQKYSLLKFTFKLRTWKCEKGPLESCFNSIGLFVLCVAVYV